VSIWGLIVLLTFLVCLVMSLYRFISRASFGEVYSGVAGKEGSKITVNWVMPPLGRESGGHINIFRFILGLEARGVECRVVICRDGIPHFTNETEEQLHSNICNWYGDFKGQVYYQDDMPEAQVTVATGWQTAYIVNQFRSTGHKCYFVQDFEPSFFPAGAEAAFAEQTYKFGFTGITAGSWLSSLLRSKYGMTTFPMSFSYDKTLYFKRERLNKDKKRLLCYVRAHTARRGWELMDLALEIIKERDPSIEFILAGGAVDLSNSSYTAFNPGSVPVEELGDLYSQSDLAVILSFTNLSLLPLEVMSCGTPVITNRGGNVEWLLSEGGAIFSEPTPIAIADAVIKTLNLPRPEYDAISAKGLAFAQNTSWENEFDRLASVLEGVTGVKTKGVK
jgi:glycosyltransferase involved in cell wall biosynthesis